jgi:hypothetical protein
MATSPSATRPARHAQDVVDSPRGKFTISAASPVQDIYLREVKGNNNGFWHCRQVAVRPGARLQALDLAAEVAGWISPPFLVQCLNAVQYGLLLF